MKTIVLACCFALLSMAGFATEPVDINTADAQTLATALSGVGPAKAQAIIDYREENGPFKTADDLVQVKGIGERTVALNVDVILVSTPKVTASKPKQ